MRRSGASTEKTYDCDGRSGIEVTRALGLLCEIAGKYDFAALDHIVTVGIFRYVLQFRFRDENRSSESDDLPNGFLDAWDHCRRQAFKRLLQRQQNLGEQQCAGHLQPLALPSGP